MATGIAGPSVINCTETDGHFPFSKMDFIGNQLGVHGTVNIVATCAGPGPAILEVNKMKILFPVPETSCCRCGFIKEQIAAVAGKTDQETLLIRRGINLFTV